MDVTRRKIEANRTNALKSTGPGTPEGKSRSRWNALKHGLLAKAVIIDRGEAKERREDFDELLRGLQEDLAAEGTLEHMLVEKIAVDYWRLRRHLSAEKGGIRRQVDTLEAKAWRITEGMVSEAMEQLKAQGLRLPEEEALYRELEELGERGTTLQELSEVVRSRTEELRKRTAVLDAENELIIDAVRLSLLAPPRRDLELSMRYETMLERQLERDLRSLADVQRVRLQGQVSHQTAAALPAQPGAVES